MIRTGLLELLKDEILVSPDSITNSLLPSIVNPENLIVMANHNNSYTVNAVVKVWSFLNNLDCRVVNSFVFLTKLLYTTFCIVYAKVFFESIREASIEINFRAGRSACLLLYNVFNFTFYESDHC